ncbi:hypothetical protein wNi1_04500 [Wolbachia pipientis]
MYKFLYTSKLALLASISAVMYDLLINPAVPGNAAIVSIAIIAHMPSTDISLPTPLKLIVLVREIIELLTTNNND